MSSELEQLFGPTLKIHDGGEIKSSGTMDVLKDCEAIGIYFSAHWCPPCRHFTPVLANAYRELRAAGKKFQVVFASSDKDIKSFNEYYGQEHPWTAIPFEDRERKNALSRKYKVSGIPTLIIIDNKGETITTQGRSVINNPKKFPWIPPTVSESLGNSFLSGDGTLVEAASIKDKTIGLYFSAHWCGPCRGFTPSLAATYNKLKQRGEFEIIFVSSDRDQGSFNTYFAEMPWLALPFDRRNGKEELSSKFEIQGIPSLVILGPEDPSTGQRPVINKDARGTVGMDPHGLKFPWYPPLYCKLEEADFLNDTPTLVVLAEGCDDGRIDDLKKDLEKVATLSKTEDIGFAIAEPGDKLADRIRALTQISTPSDDGDFILIDVSDSGAFYTGGTEEDLMQFYTQVWKEKSIARQQLKMG